MARGASVLPSAILDLPAPQSLACAVLLAAIADLDSPDHCEDARRFLAESDHNYWLDQAGLFPEARDRVVAHLAALATQEAPPAPPKAPPDLPEPPPPRPAGQTGLSDKQIRWAQRMAGHLSQRQIAAALGVTPRAVTYRLRQQGNAGPPTDR